MYFFFVSFFTPLLFFHLFFFFVSIYLFILFVFKEEIKEEGE